MAYQYVREPLTAEEADRLCAACKSAEERLVIFGLLETGLRVSELCGLTPENVQWQQRSLRIRGKGGPFGTRSKVRVVPLSDRLRVILEPYFMLKERMPLGPRAVQKLVKRVANRAQVTRPVTPHVLRHTFATLSMQKGVSLPAVQKTLGHERLSTTAIYLNLSPEHILDEYRKKW